MSKPLIGVTGDISERMLTMRMRYVESVSEAGGIPVVLPPCISQYDLPDLVARLDGLLIMGGCDVDPLLYGQTAIPECGALKPERDALETNLVRAARVANLPTLGICRGSQVMNVVYGGTLTQDIEKQLGIDPARHRQVEDYAVCTHKVKVTPDTLLASIVKTPVVEVNSRHHQCVDQLGKGLVVNGVSTEDGIIESFNDPDHRFMLGVQWHPEMLAHLREDAAALFGALVAAARK